MKLSDRNIFNLVNYSYYTLCLIGLSWQVCEISLNYFQFLTVSSIKITMPGKEKRKALNVCFNSRAIFHATKFKEIFNDYNSTETGRSKILAVKLERDRIWGKYRLMKFYGVGGKIIEGCKDIEWDIDCYFDQTEILRKIFTISDRFQISLAFEDMFQSPNSFGQRFIFRDMICYHVTSNISRVVELSWDPDIGNPRSHFPKSLKIKTVNIDGKGLPVQLLGRIDQIAAVLSPEQKLPWIEFAFTPWLWPQFNNTNVHYDISANSYVTDRMTAPYIDSCQDYTELGFIDHNDAINSCINDIILQRYGKCYYSKLYSHKTSCILQDNQKVGVLGDLIWYFRDECTLRYKEPDCHSEDMFSKIRPLTGNIGYNLLTFSAPPSKDPSFEIASQAKIAVIDYVTYILGACGTWFGFSFLTINPANSFPNPNTSSDSEQETETNGVTNSLYKIRIRKLEVKQTHQKREIVGLKNQLSKFDREFAILKNDRASS